MINKKWMYVIDGKNLKMKKEIKMDIIKEIVVNSE
jgi:hypothetical protein